MMTRTGVTLGLIVLMAAGVFSRGWCEEPRLTIAPGQANSVNVELSNETLVRGVQFTLGGVKITEVRTTQRTKGFLAKFNEKSGMVLMVSASGINIQPGSGSIAEIICNKPGDAGISGVTVVKAVPPAAEKNNPDKAGEQEKK